MSYVLTPMTVTQTQALLGADFIHKFQKEMDEYLAPYRKNIKIGRPLSMGKELWEYAVADSISNASWCGAGKSIIDVKIGDTIGIDVKSVQTGKYSTTEASMFQYLQVERVAQHFQTQNKLELWNMFVDGWLTKVKSIGQYYLICILKDKATLNCSIVGFNVENTNLLFQEQNCEFNRESMKVTSIADPAYLDIKIYKGKTRMEMRIKEKIFNDSNYVYQIYKGDLNGKTKQTRKSK